MRICPRCLSVYGTSINLYCQFDGNKTFDIASIEGEEPSKRLLEKLRKEVTGNPFPE